MHKMVNGTKFREIGNDDDDTVLPTIRTAEATFLAAVAAALCACLPHAAPKQTHNAKSGERNKTNKRRKKEEQKNRFECNF